MFTFCSNYILGFHLTREYRFWHARIWKDPSLTPMIFAEGSNLPTMGYIIDESTTFNTSAVKLTLEIWMLEDSWYTIVWVLHQLLWVIWDLPQIQTAWPLEQNTIQLSKTMLNDSPGLVHLDRYAQVNLYTHSTCKQRMLLHIYLCEWTSRQQESSRRVDDPFSTGMFELSGRNCPKNIRK